MSSNPSPSRSPFTSLTRAQRRRFVMVFATVASLVSVLMAVIYGALYISQPAWQLAVGTMQAIPSVLLMILIMHLTQSDRETLGIYLGIPYLLLLTAFLSVTLGVVLVMGPVYVALIVLAAMVLGETGGYITATVAGMMWLVGFGLSGWGVVPTGLLTGPMVDIVTAILTVIAFFFSAFVAQAATGGLWKALDDAAYDLIEANRQLDEANRQKSKFLARMSHDLRTPLTAIKLSTDLILRDVYGPVSEKQQEALARAQQSTVRLQDLIDDILDLSKIEAGQLELNEDQVVVENIAETLRCTLEPKAEAKYLGFSVLIEPNMPARIWGDEKRLIQVMTNLADNAIKFTEKGRVTVLIGAPQPDSWHFLVTDTGRGIREADMESIFEEFHRADPNDPVPGTGLGLAITRQLVTLMGGEISVRSKLGQGSTFEVTLPLREITVPVAVNEVVGTA